MALKSMTGFASREGTLEIADRVYQWTWEIKAVNGKALDMRLRLPHLLQSSEQAVRKLLDKRITRGNLQASLSLEHDGNDQSLSLNEAMMKTVLAASEKASKSHSVAPITFDGLIAIKGMVEVDTSSLDADDLKILEQAVVADFDVLLDNLVVSRKGEGQALEAVLVDVVSEIETLSNAAQNAPERAPEAISAKLQAQLSDLIESDHGLSEERLHQEALMMAAKADIKEEIDRLLVHVDAARGFFKLDEPVGRRLDFLSQEFGREANTLCSKANDVAITNIGLALKAAIDQFREQIQNVE